MDDSPSETGSVPVLFPVATWKLALMGVVSFGLYEVYWGYRHWLSAKVALGEPMWSFARGVFLPFTFRFLARDADEIFANRGFPERVRWEWLGAAYFLLGIATNCAGVVSLLLTMAITPLRLVPLILFQRQVNRANLVVAGVEPDEEFGPVTWLAFVLGGSLTLGLMFIEALQLATR